MINSRGCPVVRVVLKSLRFNCRARLRASPGPGETYHTTARLRAGWITLNGETVVLFGPDVSW